MPLTDDEIIASANDWRAWGKQFGWSLRGLGDTFNDEYALANFQRIDDGADGTPFNITRAMRNDIDAAIQPEK